MVTQNLQSGKNNTDWLDLIRDDTAGFKLTEENVCDPPIRNVLV